MAISIDGGSSDDKNLSPLNSDSSKNFKYKHKNKSHLIEMDFTSQRSIRRSKKLRKKVKSPYCAEDKMHLLSHMHEKQAMRRKESDVMSSFPLAAKIYKANSDEFNKMKSNKRKFKKSILTLPNEPSSTPQVYTVSDMNESEYNRNDRSVRRKQNCRAIYRHNNKPNNNERYFYEGGTQYYSKLNVDLGCSSSDIVKPLRRKRQKTLRNKHATAICGNCNGGDVWALLRNIDRLQMRPSPPMSDDSLERLKTKSRFNMKRCTQKDARLIETRTEEIAYISSYNVEDRSPITISPSSSNDRVTVIDNYNALNNLCDNINQPIRSQQSRDKKVNRSIASNLNKITNIRPKFKENNKINYEERTFMNQKGKKLFLQSANPNKHCKNQPTGGPCCPGTCPAITNNYHEYSAQHYPIEDFQGTHIDKNKGATVTSTESSRHVLKGITKVVLKENEKVLQGVNDLPKRKPRLVTTMPSSCNSPKLTIFDKRRMIAKHKFPIIILTKDQVSPVRISNFEFDQFEGLNQQIWPYMLDWFEKDPIKKNKLREQKKTTDQTIQKSDKISVQKPTDTSSYYKKNINLLNCNKNETQIELEKVPKAPKCLNQIKDRMLQLLNQKSVTNSTTVRDLAISSPNGLSHIIKKQCINGFVDVGTDPKIVHNAHSKSFCTRPPERFSRETTLVPSPKTKESQTLMKPDVSKISRNKQKLASDFIEDVIHKVKNGVYFNKNTVCPTKAKKRLSRTTEIINETNNDLKPETKESEMCYELGETTTSLLITNIPGFDKPLPALEVLTFSNNRIAIKQRYTNITMQFDIDMIIPFEFCNLPKSDTVMTSLLNSCENHLPNIMKYERTILNSVLPAELCSIVPKMLRELSMNKTKMVVSSVKVNEIQPQLANIAELPRCNSIIAQVNSIMSAGQKMLCNGGRYYRHVSSFRPTNRLKLNSSYFNDGTISKIFQNLETDKLFLIQKVNLPRMLYLRQEKFQPADLHNDSTIDLGLKSNKCLQLSEYRGKFDLRAFIEKIINSSNFTMVVNIQNFLTMYSFEFSKITDILTDKIVIKVTMDTYQPQGSQNSNCQIKPIIASSSDLESGNNIQRKNVVSTKLRKTKYFKLYRKCKSTSNIPEAKKCTPLDEVTNLEEFCQVLGSGKTLSSVFNGLEKLIMGCLTQLKTWISEISSTQAMLVLLLLNKKDSPNLTRLRPVILQAIAVKRITRANELDMEVEVIENEKFKRLPEAEYTQMTHKPAALTVIDPDDESLLEELCWIAKTTASDYHRVYDETSEKLLKLLINKRKKLNPSYLRVMARYVGLGLLKSPGKL